jgi:glycosyltransferase involved in cell wall biosynthesis
MHLGDSISMGELREITAIVKTFHRPNSLDRLIRSVRRYYPHLAIAVADDGIVPSPRNDVDYVRLPIDVGLSAGRNALLRHIKTPYFLLLDDDLEFTRKTRIECLLELVASGAVDVASGDYYRCKRKLLFVSSRWQPFHGNFRFQDGELQLTCETHSTHPCYQLCDLVHNFFVARTADVLALGGWDEDLKLNEHVEFFVRLGRARRHVAYCPGVTARHWMERHADYTPYRDRDFTALAAKKIGVTRVNRFDGQPIGHRSRSAA